jgi:hypothetical protein
MGSPGRSRSIRLFAQGRARRQLLPRPGVLNRRLGLATAAHCGCAADQQVCRRATDDRKLFDRPVVVEDATLSPPMKRTSWTSQLL